MKFGHYIYISKRASPLSQKNIDLGGMPNCTSCNLSMVYCILLFLHTGSTVP